MSKGPVARINARLRALGRVRSPAGMKGTVLRVVETGSVPYARVKWTNGYTGNITITLLTKEQ